MGWIKWLRFKSDAFGSLKKLLTSRLLPMMLVRMLAQVELQEIGLFLTHERGYMESVAVVVHVFTTFFLLQR